MIEGSKMSYLKQRTYHNFYRFNFFLAKNLKRDPNSSGKEGRRSNREKHNKQSNNSRAELTCSTCSKRTEGTGPFVIRGKSVKASRFL